MTSCDCEILVKAEKNGTYSVSYKSAPGAAFLDTIFAVSGGEEEVFDQAEIKKSAEQAGIEAVDVSATKENRFGVKGKIYDDGQNLFTAGGFIENGRKNVRITEENLMAFYKNSPPQFQSYMDLFMAPVFTEEKMSDEEYLGLVEEVYGKPLRDEVEKSTVKFIFENENGKRSEIKKGLVQLFNLKKDIILK